MKKRWSIEDVERLHNKGLSINIDAIPRVKPEFLAKMHETTGFYYMPSTPPKESIILNITPIPKPRMVKSDAWKKRPCVVAYWQWKNQLNIAANQVGLHDLPESGFHVIYHLPMPGGWTKKKRALMNGKPHQSKPDGDNLQKALQDCLCKTDQHIWDFRVTKLWAEKGAIEIKMSDNNE